jgi:hypothetical protein
MPDLLADIARSVQCKRTASRVQTATTAITFEMLRLLVRDQDLHVVEVALAVEAPRSLLLLLESWPSLSLLRHPGGVAQDEWSLVVSERYQLQLEMVLTG